MNMSKWLALPLLLIIVNFSVKAQVSPVIIDDRFEDWQTIPFISDPQNDGGQLDMTGFSVTEDGQNIYFFLEILQEHKLVDPVYSGHHLSLWLDTDYSAVTGKPFQNLGADLEIDFTGRIVRYHFPQVGSDSFLLSETGFRSAPTVTGFQYEFSISKTLKPDGSNTLFPIDSFRFYFHTSTGDLMPDYPMYHTHLIDNQASHPYDTVDIHRDSSHFIRLMSYNMLWDGITDPNRKPHHAQIASVLKPDIITYNEGGSVTLTEVLDFVKAADTSYKGPWYAMNYNTSIITVSKFPILDSFLVDNRLTGALIDLPDSIYATDYLVFNAHAPCCGNDAGRQTAADKFVSFIRKIKDTSVSPYIPYGTPYSISGDFNLVGWKKQLETFRDGDIKDNHIYGPDIMMDWDENPLIEAACLQTDRNMHYSWRSLTSNWPPGKLDFVLYTSSIMGLEKSYSLQTETMEASRLSKYGLLNENTWIASDHLPLIADFRFEMKTDTGITGFISPKNRSFFTTFPNPFDHTLNLITNSTAAMHYCTLSDSSGKIVASISLAEGQDRIELPNLPDGLYHLQIKSSNGEIHSQQLVKKGG